MANIEKVKWNASVPDSILVFNGFMFSISDPWSNVFAQHLPEKKRKNCHRKFQKPFAFANSNSSDYLSVCTVLHCDSFNKFYWNKYGDSCSFIIFSKAILQLIWHSDLFFNSFFMRFWRLLFLLSLFACSRTSFQ